MANSDTRTERPEYVALGIEPKSMSTSATLENLFFESDLAPDVERQPNSLYVPDYPVSERDETLGIYLSAWNKVERQLVHIMELVLGRDDRLTARVIFDLGLNVNQITDLILSHIRIEQDKEKYSDISNWLKRYKRANTRRNRLVHADWLCELKLGVGMGGEIEIAHWQWLRQFSPSDVDSKLALQNRDPKAVGRFIHSIGQICRASEHCLGLAELAIDIQRKWGSRPPERPAPGDP